MLLPGCPKSRIGELAIQLVGLVDWSESVHVLPSAQTLFDESLFYYEVRSIVLSERNIAKQEMAPKEKAPAKNKTPVKGGKR